MKDFMDSTGYGGRLGDFAIDTLNSEMVVKMKEQLWRLKERNLLIHMRPACFIGVREKLREFYSATCYDIGGDTNLDDVGTYQFW